MTWTTVAEPDPDEDEIRFVTDATPVFKAEGVWRGNGAVWFVSSYALGPDATVRRSAGPNDSEFAGATFSPDGRTLYVNIQEPGHTFAIYGPWQAFRGHG